jgi:hypothetical protein
MYFWNIIPVYMYWSCVEQFDNGCYRNIFQIESNIM